MESKKLDSPSHEKVSSSASSSAPPQTLYIHQSPGCSPDGSSPLIVCGHSLQMTADQHSNMLSNPSFGLYTPAPVHSEFERLRSLGLSALVAQSQVGAFQEWWRPAETQTNGSAAFFHPFLGLHPVFVSAFKNLGPVDVQSHTSGFTSLYEHPSKDLYDAADGNGTVKSRRAPTPAMNSAVNSSLSPAKEAKEKPKLITSRSQKGIHGSLHLYQKISKTKTKPIKSLLGSLSESSSDEETSSELNDEDGPSSDDSDSEKKTQVKREVNRLTHTSERKKKRPRAAHGSTAQESLCHSVSVTSPFQLQSAPHPPGPHQSMSLFLQRARTAEEDQQHISVIQPTALTVSKKTLARSHRQTRPSSFKTSSNPDPLKYIPTLNSPKHLTSSNHTPSCSLKPLALHSPNKRLFSLTKSPMLSTSKESSHRAKTLTHLSKHTQEGSRDIQRESSAHLNNLQLKRPLHLKDSVKQASSVPLKNQSEKNLLLNLHLNGVTHSAVQDAPLALVTKPRSLSRSPTSEPLLGSTSPPSLTPINLSTGTKETSFSSGFKSSASSGPVPGSRETSVVLNGGKSLTKPVDLTRSIENGSDDSCDDEEDDSEDDDSGNSLSDSESNLESDCSEDHLKEGDTDADTTPLKPAETFVLKSSSNFSSSCFQLNQQITEPLVLPSLNLRTPINNMESLNKQDISSSAVTFAATPVSKRKRVTDERALHLPLTFGWQRETRIRTAAGRLQGKVAYFAPCGKKLRQYSDVMKYLFRNGITEISRENFSFSTKAKVGHFYEIRETPEGLQWFLLTEDEIASSIIAMDGRRSRRLKLEQQLTSDGSAVKYPHPGNVGENDLQDANDAKLLRKLEAQEIARQAAQIKMKRKLEKQAIAQAAKEAKRQKAMIAAEERRKKREEMKIFRQQEKIKRIQHIRMEKEFRAQQVLEEKRKKKEVAANAKLVETEKRNKEKEIRRLQAVILKQQELERHRLEMERERRRQHIILMKAVEAQKKAEEKERLKQERKEKKQLNKEKKLELRRLELEKAKELKKPNEDMCLADHQPLPELCLMPGLILPGKPFSDCLMVLQFLRNFGKVLRLDFNSDSLTISNLQQGLLNTGKSMHKVQDLLVSMLSAAVCDPGVPAGCKCKTILGDHLTSVEINQDNVSEILQIYMESHSEDTELASLAVSLKTKAFQAHSPSQKAAMLAFLVNELCCSKAVINEIDKNIDCMTNLRKDKWIVEGKLRKLKNIQVKTLEKRDSRVRGEDNGFNGSTFRNGCKRKEMDSEEEEYEDDDSEDRDEEEEDSRGKKKKKAEICEDEDEGVHSVSTDELEKQIEKTYRLQSQIRQKLFDSSHSLRSMMIGEDRYKRRYWVLPQCGGIFIEGVENGSEEEERRLAAQVIGVKEEHQEQEERKQEVSISAHISDCDKTKPDSPRNNLFLQNPSSLSKLSKLFEVAKMTDISHQNTPPETYPSHPTSQTEKIYSPESSELTPLTNSNWMTHSPQSILHYDQLSKILTEKSKEWFSLLPRSPCDGSSVTSSSSSPASSSSPQPIRAKPPSLFFPNPSATSSQLNKAGINNVESSIPQEVGLNGNRDLCLEDTSSVKKGETTDPLSNELLSGSIPAVEVPKTQDYPHPRPIPKEMLRGWWRVSDMEGLQNLIKTLHSRGIRERVLQKQIQKHMEHMTRIFKKRKDGGTEIDLTELEMSELSTERVESWCVEERAMEVDVNLLRQVEALEKRVVAANLHIEGWMPHQSQADSESLVYYEHKHSALGQTKTNQEENSVYFTRLPNNPLDIAVTRLSDLERNIERSEEEVASGMKQWRKALHRVCSSAQLSLCIQQLQKTITWDRAIMKVHCQLCQKGDDEELLLICDGCNKGCHTYCYDPKITTVPDGDWFCSFCVAKESGQTPHSRKQQSRTAGEGKRCSEGRRNGKPSVAGERVREEAASSNSVPKRGTKEFKKRRGDDSSQDTDDRLASCAKRSKTFNEGSSELAVCKVLLAELEAHQDAWPFLRPVNHKAVPGYKKVIKKPMDFSTIKEKLTNNLYLNLETFITDVNLVFDNCKTFNEDDSVIGRAGYNMRRFFDKRWTELLQ